MRVKKRKIDDIPHFTKELELLNAFAEEYLSFNDRELDEKLAMFVEEIQLKYKPKCRLKKSLNTTKTEIKPPSSNKSFNKTMNDTYAQFKEKK